MIYKLAASFVLASFLFGDQTNIPPTKTDIKVAPNATQYWRAQDSNNVRQDLLDIQSGVGTRPVNASAGTLTPSNLANGAVYHVMLDANLTVANPSTAGLTAGTRMRFVFAQDTTGGRSVTWGNAFISAARFLPRQGSKQASGIEWVFDGVNWQIGSFDGVDTSKPLDIRDFGAVTTSSDNWQAIQNALAEAASLSTTIGTQPPVRIPAGGPYYHQRPIVLGNYQQLIGDGMNASFLNSTQYTGPNIFISGPASALPVQPSLADGGGSAVVLDGGASYSVNFNNVPFLTLNGLSQFSAEFFMTETVNGGSLLFYGNTGANNGTVEPDHVGHTTFSIGSANLASLNTGGTVHNLGFTPPTNQIVEVELSYDGSNIRLFFNGVLQQTVAATGAIASTIAQDFIIGAIPGQFPNFSGAYASMANGAIDSVRLSNLARHTSNFTAPTTKFTYDGNTLFLANFDQITAAPTLVGYRVMGNTQAWAPFQPRDNASTCSNVTVRDMTISGNGTGISALGALQSFYKNLYFSFTFGGLFLEDFTYGSVVDNIQGLAGTLNGSTPSGWGSRFGLFIGHGGGLTSVKNINLAGYAYTVWTEGGPSFENIFLTPTTSTIWPFVAFDSQELQTASDAVAVKNLSADFENSNPLAQGQMFVSGISNITVRDSAFDLSASGNGLPSITIFNVGNLIIDGDQFAGGNTPGPIFRFITTSSGTFAGTPHNPGKPNGNNPVLVLNSYRQKGIASWTDPGAEQWVQVEEPGFSSGLRYGVKFIDAGYSATFADEIIAVTSFPDAGFTVTLPLPDAGATGKEITVKDQTCQAGTYHITESVAGGGTIDSLSSQSITGNCGSVVNYTDGKQWYIKKGVTNDEFVACYDPSTHKATAASLCKFTLTKLGTLQPDSAATVQNAGATTGTVTYSVFDNAACDGGTDYGDINFACNAAINTNQSMTVNNPTLVPGSYYLCHAASTCSSSDPDTNVLIHLVE